MIKKRNKIIRNKTICVILSRMESSRLPGKALMPFLKKPNIQHIVERIRRAKSIDEIIVATIKNKENLEIVELCKKIKCLSYRSEYKEDVLGTLYSSAKILNAKYIVDITGDCPLIDPFLIDYLVFYLIYNNFDYASNVIERTWPRGFDVQVCTMKALDKLVNITDPKTRKHSLWNFTYYPDEFKMFNLEAPDEYKYPDFRLTLDTKEDYFLINKIFNYFDNNRFNYKDIIDYLKRNPDIVSINSHIKQKGIEEG